MHYLEDIPIMVDKEVAIIGGNIDTTEKTKHHIFEIYTNRGRLYKCNK